MVVERVGSAQDFLSQLEDLSKKTEINISNIDIGKKEDRRLLLQVLLRGKTEDEYFSIVNGLFKAHDEAQGEGEKERLLNLATDIMALGEENLRIDWH